MPARYQRYARRDAPYATLARHAARFFAGMPMLTPCFSFRFTTELFRRRYSIGCYAIFFRQWSSLFSACILPLLTIAYNTRHADACWRALLLMFFFFPDAIIIAVVGNAAADYAAAMPCRCALLFDMPLRAMMPMRRGTVITVPAASAQTLMMLRPDAAAAAITRR